MTIVFILEGWRIGTGTLCLYSEAECGRDVQFAVCGEAIPMNCSPLPKDMDLILFAAFWLTRQSKFTKRKLSFQVQGFCVVALFLSVFTVFGIPCGRSRMCHPSIFAPYSPSLYWCQFPVVFVVESGSVVGKRKCSPPTVYHLLCMPVHFVPQTVSRFLSHCCSLVWAAPPDDLQNTQNVSRSQTENEDHQGWPSCDHRDRSEDTRCWERSLWGTCCSVENQLLFPNVTLEERLFLRWKQKSVLRQAKQQDLLNRIRSTVSGSFYNTEATGWKESWWCENKYSGLGSCYVKASNTVRVEVGWEVTLREPVPLITPDTESLRFFLVGCWILMKWDKSSLRVPSPWWWPSLFVFKTAVSVSCMACLFALEASSCTSVYICPCFRQHCLQCPRWISIFQFLVEWVRKNQGQFAKNQWIIFQGLPNPQFLCQSSLGDICLCGQQSSFAVLMRLGINYAGLIWHLGKKKTGLCEGRILCSQSCLNFAFVVSGENVIPRCISAVLWFQPVSLVVTVPLHSESNWRNPTGNVQLWLSMPLQLI